MGTRKGFIFLALLAGALVLCFITLVLLGMFARIWQSQRQVTDSWAVLNAAAGYMAGTYQPTGALQVREQSLVLPELGSLRSIEVLKDEKVVYNMFWE